MDNIYTTVQAFATLLKVLGVFPMSFEGPARKGVLKTKFRDVVITIFPVSVLIVLILFALLDHKLVTIESSILAKAWNFCLILGLFMLLVAFVYQIIHRHNIRDLLQLLDNFDQEVCVTW